MVKRSNLPQFPKPRKYNNEPVTIDGMRFDSKAEGKRYETLKQRLFKGEIVDLVCQKKALRFKVTINGKLICAYVADFMYTETATGRLVVEDVKGVRTPIFRLKKRLVESIYPIKITEVPA